MSVATQSLEEGMLNIASQSLEEYGEIAEQWGNEHRVLEECWRCEDWLTTGLETLGVINAVDAVLHTGAKLGRLDLTHDIQDTILSQYELWLKPSSLAEQRIVSLDQQQQAPSNATEFREAVLRIRTLVDERKKRREKIQSVDRTMLQRLAKVRRPPVEWFDDDENCQQSIAMPSSQLRQGSIIFEDELR